MKFTQFVKHFRDENPDLGMTHADCMKNADIKRAFRELVGTGTCIQQKDKNVNVIINIKEKDADIMQPSGKPQSSGRQNTAPGPAVVKGGPTLPPIDPPAAPVPGPPPTQQLNTGNISFKSTLPKQTSSQQTDNPLSAATDTGAQTDPSLSSNVFGMQTDATATASQATQVDPSSAASTAAEIQTDPPAVPQLKRTQGLNSQSIEPSPTTIKFDEYTKEVLQSFVADYNDMLRQRNDLARITEALLESHKKTVKDNEDLKQDAEFLKQAAKDSARHGRERAELQDKLQQLTTIRNMLDADAETQSKEHAMMTRQLEAQVESVIGMGRNYERIMNTMAAHFNTARERMSDLLNRSFVKSTVHLPSLYTHIGQRFVLKDEEGRWRYVDDQGKFLVDEEGNPTGYVPDEDRRFINIAMTAPQVGQTDIDKEAEIFNPNKRKKTKTSNDPDNTFTYPIDLSQFYPNKDDEVPNVPEGTDPPSAADDFDYSQVYPNKGEKVPDVPDSEGKGIAGPQHGFNDSAFAELEKKWQDRLWQGDFNTAKEWDSEKKKWVNMKAYRSALSRMEPLRKKALKELTVRLDKTRDAAAKKIIKGKKK